MTEKPCGWAALTKKESKYHRNDNEEILKLQNETISVKDMITALNKLPENDRLFISQWGYYADCYIGDIYSDFRTVEFNGITYHEIGSGGGSY
jgi:hypothetical protein